MGNEEKILDILALMQGEMQSFKGEMQSFKDEMQKMNAKIDHVDDRVTKTNITIENEIKPQIQALIEGQKTILETLAPKNRVEDLEDEVKFLKSFMYQMSEQLQQLKKAQ